MARRSRSGGSKAGGIVLFLLGLFVGAGILYFLKPSAPRGGETEPPAPARRQAPSRAEHRKPPADRLPSDRLPSDHVEPEAPAAVPAATETVTSAGPVHGARIAL
ncbi:MAG TPA: hypothetical protein VIJ36_20365, partial [Thermoanaerobaculia bacterium]